MAIAAKVLIVLVALFQTWALVLEMFLWTHRIGLRTFGNTVEQAQLMAVLAKNQGLYNGFLAAGLLWSLWTGATDVQIFFAACVAIAGIYGFATTGKVAILVAQGGLSALTIATILLARR